MKPSSARGVVIDTGVWLAYYTSKDEHHDKAKSIIGSIRNATILLPWPIFYEVLRTSTVKRSHAVAEFTKILRSYTVLKVDDEPYRESALVKTVEFAQAGKRQISLVDMVIRFILDDDKFRIVEFVTFNPGDFHDVCRRKNIFLRQQ